MQQPDLDFGMIENGTRRAVSAAIRATLAASDACEERDFLADGLVIARAAERAGRLRFPIPSRPFQAVTLGAGVVVSCDPRRFAWVRAHLGPLGRDAIFAAPTIGLLARYLARSRQDLVGPVLRYACARDDLRPAPTPAGVTITLIEQEAIGNLYRQPGFHNALSYRADNPRPDMLATVAHRAGEIVGIAGVSADSDALWQIGIDVVPTARGRGIGRALVSHLTAATFAAGRIPFYTTTVANLPSRQLARSLGYWPAWTDLYAQDR
jgi:GNAT superfamily N-acetyltransferase